jgi:hypothetical protein
LRQSLAVCPDLGLQAKLRRLPGRPGRCFVPLGGLAQGDFTLAQKIALETEESLALSVANSFPGAIGWRLLCRRPLEGRGSRVRLFLS